MEAYAGKPLSQPSVHSFARWIKDDLEFRIKIDNKINHNLMYSSNSVKPSEPLLESQYVWVIAGIALILLGIGIENKRRTNAKNILSQFALENKWD